MMKVDFPVVKRLLLVLIFGLILSAIAFVATKFFNQKTEISQTQNNVTTTKVIQDKHKFQKEQEENEIWSCVEGINQAYLFTDLEKLNDLKRTRLFADNRFAVLKNSPFSETFYDFRCIGEF